MWGDEKQLEIVIYNLVKNALEAMQGAENRINLLWLATSGQNGTIDISIKDSGHGVRNQDVRFCQRR